METEIKDYLAFNEIVSSDFPPDSKHGDNYQNLVFRLHQCSYAIKNRIPLRRDIVSGMNNNWVQELSPGDRSALNTLDILREHRKSGKKDSLVTNESPLVNSHINSQKKITDTLNR